MDDLNFMVQHSSASGLAQANFAIFAVQVPSNILAKGTFNSEY